MSLTAATIAASFYFLYLAIKYLPTGTAYVVWMGIGTAGAAILEMIVFGEAREVSKIFYILLIVMAIVGLKLTSTH